MRIITMLIFIDNFLNNITMYRLVLYVLLILVGVAEIFSFFHLLPFSPIALLLSTSFLIILCWITNKVFSVLFKIQTNFESVYISALILSLIITPQSVVFPTFAALFTIASKYLVSLNKKHIFNPVALGVFLGGLVTGNFASWWVGTASLMPFVVLGGFLIVRKIRREDMVFTFFIIAILTILGFDFFNKSDLLVSLKNVALETPIIFFASVMLTEPLTTPPTQILQSMYGGIVGILYSPLIHIGTFYTSPEIALLLGNIFSYIMSPKIRLRLVLHKKISVTKDISTFIFHVPRPISFLPGQYMEWTLSHNNIDSRGNRRYFTVASSPTEHSIMIGVRFNAKGSSFKNALTHLSENNEIIASQIAGDFTLPHDTTKKLVFVSGGIGVTPFRSMVKYLLDKKEKRDIVVLYSAKSADDFAYKEIFDEAANVLGIKIVYTVTDKDNTPSYWKGHVGRIDSELIQKEIPDFQERLFYLSGPNAMIESFETLLKNIGVKHIKKDYFPGFA